MKFAFSLPDGSVTILAAAPKEQLERSIGTPMLVDGVMRRVLTDEEYRAHVLDRNREKGVIPADAIDLVELPPDWTAPDRTFRAAWTKSETTFGHDMAKARNIHRDRLRAQREPLLRELDGEYIRALEANDRAKQAEIAARKQQLRDAPANPAIDAAQTVEALKAVVLP